jgi:hypothetical protein
MKITKEYLDELRADQQSPSFGSTAKSMFIEGVFNPDNWNGGDGHLIRNYLDSIFMDSFIADVETEFFSGTMIATHTTDQDQNYATFVLHDPIKETHSLAYFSWYKSRGATEVAIFDGHLMTENEYLLILNAIQDSGYDLKAKG